MDSGIPADCSESHNIPLCLHLTDPLHFRDSPFLKNNNHRSQPDIQSSVVCSDYIPGEWVTPLDEQTICSCRVQIPVLPGESSDSSS